MVLDDLSTIQTILNDTIEKTDALSELSEKKRPLKRFNELLASYKLLIHDIKKNMFRGECSNLVLASSYSRATSTTSC